MYFLFNCKWLLNSSSASIKAEFDVAELFCIFKVLTANLLPNWCRFAVVFSKITLLPFMFSKANAGFASSQTFSIIYVLLMSSNKSLNSTLKSEFSLIKLALISWTSFESFILEYFIFKISLLEKALSGSLITNLRSKDPNL
ncbi:Uncharacterised protein (plasmid) [Mycoplasmopsis canis]|uniref:Uncharacterized protein n=1 Tax=Mycoplasmopsis canis TaxID=29555 RepID=A0A449ARU4_9BACT|nr:hypothetical protein [Mycoplasmopsis canis]VEU69248.1 Uncharacterised protein [Mycoplasmopsis canis]